MLGGPGVSLCGNNQALGIAIAKGKHLIPCFRVVNEGVVLRNATGLGQPQYAAGMVLPVLCTRRSATIPNAHQQGFVGQPGKPGAIVASGVGGTVLYEECFYISQARVTQPCPTQGRGALPIVIGPAPGEVEPVMLSVAVAIPGMQDDIEQAALAPRADFGNAVEINGAAVLLDQRQTPEIGRASCRERV